jgi:hypothetical protein
MNKAMRIYDESLVSIIVDFLASFIKLYHANLELCNLLIDYLVDLRELNFDEIKKI